MSFQGWVITAAILGIITGSWTLFFVILICGMLFNTDNTGNKHG